MTATSEESRIGRALASVSSWTEEIILVLNEEVRDRTEEIARSFGAKVYREPWRGFQAQFNSAAEKGTQPWLFCLSADEVAGPGLEAEVRGVLEGSSGQTGRAALSFPRCSFYLGRWIRHGDWYPDRGTRIWQNGKARWVGTNPHVYLQVDGAVADLNSEILHYTCDNLNDHLAKIRAYSDLFVVQRQAAQKRFRGVDLVFRPPWRFFRSYFLKSGFLDGWPGFCLSGMIAMETFVRYAKLYEARVTSNHPPSNPSQPSR